MYYIAICDDEEYFLCKEKALIAHYMQKNKHQCEIDIFSSGKELLEQGNNLAEYDMIFLDVCMNEMDGIETAKRIRNLTKNVYIAFVTAFVDYSLEGYKVDATRYILKDKDCLEKTMTECLDTILFKMNYTSEKKVFEFQEGSIQIFLDDILYIESKLHKLIFHIYKNEYLDYNMYEKLDIIDEMLNEFGFCRIHKSYLVNLKYINDIERYRVKLYNNRYLNIAKPRYQEVKKEFIVYIGRK